MNEISRTVQRSRESAGFRDVTGYAFAPIRNAVAGPRQRSNAVSRFEQVLRDVRANESARPGEKDRIYGAAPVAMVAVFTRCISELVRHVLSSNISSSPTANFRTRP